MTKAFSDVYSECDRRKIDMRIAAYIVAVLRVAEAMHDRGWTPSLHRTHSNEEEKD